MQFFSVLTDVTKIAIFYEKKINVIRTQGVNYT